MEAVTGSESRPSSSTSMYGAEARRLHLISWSFWNGQRLPGNFATVRDENIRAGLPVRLHLKVLAVALALDSEGDHCGARRRGRGRLDIDLIIVEKCGSARSCWYLGGRDYRVLSPEAERNLAGTLCGGLRCPRRAGVDLLGDPSRSVTPRVTIAVTSTSTSEYARSTIQREERAGPGSGAESLSGWGKRSLTAAHTNRERLGRSEMRWSKSARAGCAICGGC